MTKKIVKLSNAIFWDRQFGDKVYIESVQIAIVQFPFALRQVFLRFVNGPSMDFSTVDMDRLAVEYLKLRGIKLPAEARNLAKAKAPLQADFLVPDSLLPESLKPSNDSDS